MATKIGFDMLHFAPVIEDENGYESYGRPRYVKGSIAASIVINTAETAIVGDGECVDTVNSFDGGTISIDICDIGERMAAEILGCRVDKNGVLVHAQENRPKAVAIGFRALKSDGGYKYVWLYRVKFSIPASNSNTNSESIVFNTQKIEGKILRRNRPDSHGDHPWKATVDTSVRDVDIAEEMMMYTKNNILVQYAQSLLDQANQAESESTVRDTDITDPKTNTQADIPSDNNDTITATETHNAQDDAENANNEKISTGCRVNRAGDDAAGLAISLKYRHWLLYYWFSHVYEPDEDKIDFAESIIRDTDAQGVLGLLR